MTIHEIRERVMNYHGATVMANAFRAAFSMPQIWIWSKHNEISSADRYKDLMECFENPTSPMDGRYV